MKWKRGKAVGEDGERAEGWVVKGQGRGGGGRVARRVMELAVIGAAVRDKGQVLLC